MSDQENSGLVNKQEHLQINDKLSEISDKVSSVNTSIKAHSERLGKIEEAILQLAATRERVQNVESQVKVLRETQIQETKNVWDAFDKVRESQMDCLQSRAVITEKTITNEKHICELESWKSNVAPQIEGNTRTRGILEKFMYAILLFIVIGVLGSVLVFAKPNSNEAQYYALDKKLDTIGQLIENHIKEQTHVNVDAGEN